MDQADSVEALGWNLEGPVQMPLFVVRHTEKGKMSFKRTFLLY